MAIGPSLTSSNVSQPFELSLAKSQSVAFTSNSSPFTELSTSRRDRYCRFLLHVLTMMPLSSSSLLHHHDDLDVDLTTYVLVFVPASCSTPYHLQDADVARLGRRRYDAMAVAWIIILIHRYHS